jgi:hypothetical protein
MNKKKSILYKNDLKFSENLDLEQSEFESDNVKEIYNDYKTRPKIDLRIKDSELENYEYLDLSKLDMNDDILIKLMELEKIKKILSKIKFLDLSNNNLKMVPELFNYKNIIYLNVSSNKIGGNLDSNNLNDNLIELVCDDNNITNIESNSLERLVASNNLIENIFVPNIKLLVINNNKLIRIDSYNKLTYLECIDNNIEMIDNMENVEEIYISNNKIINIGKIMPKITILNCAKNPINKISYYNKLNFLVCSTSYISSKYKIQHMNKVKDDYFISFNHEN